MQNQFILQFYFLAMRVSTSHQIIIDKESANRLALPAFKSKETKIQMQVRPTEGDLNGSTRFLNPCANGREPKIFHFK